jgi:hypothetical protein
MFFHFRGCFLIKKNKKQPKNAGNNTWYAIAAGALIIIVIAVFLTNNTQGYDEFATCLVDKGYVMAGTEWCSYCNEQKRLFRGSFEDVIIPAGAFKDCDREMQWCREHGVTGYPTWVTPEGGLIPGGVQPLPTLARISGCSL